MSEQQGGAPGSGRFVVIEGLDGAGTTTQSRRLVARLGEQGLGAHLTWEPSGGPVGVMIRQMLAMRIVQPKADGTRGAVDRETLALLFAADRLDHVASEVDPRLGRGEWVVSDRYYHSSLAYQGDVDGQEGVDYTWVRSLNARAREPDVTFFLRAPVDLCMERLGQRSLRDLYETREKLARLERRYDEVMAMLAAEGQPIEVLDASRSVADLSDAILERVLALR